MNYRHRLALYPPSDKAPNQFNPADTKPRKVAEVFAQVKGEPGSESETAEQQRSYERYTIKMRWGPTIAAINAKWHADWLNHPSGKVKRLNFASVADVEGKNRELVIQAVANG